MQYLVIKTNVKGSSKVEGECSNMSDCKRILKTKWEQHKVRSKVKPSKLDGLRNSNKELAIGTDIWKIFKPA